MKSITCVSKYFEIIKFGSIKFDIVEVLPQYTRSNKDLHHSRTIYLIFV